VLERYNEWVQHEGDEPGDEEDEDDVPDPVDQLSAEVSDSHDRDADEDRAQRDASGFDGGPKGYSACCPAGSVR